MTGLPRALRADLDGIVARYRGPEVTFTDELKPVTRRLRASARRRARVLTTAAATLDALIAEGDRVQRTPNGSQVLDVAGTYRLLRARDVADVAGELATVAGTLRGIAGTLAALYPPDRAGRHPDVWRKLITRDVARACLAHGVRFSTETPTSEAARVLANVFEHTGRSLSGDGLRPYLAYAQRVQARATE